MPFLSIWVGFKEIMPKQRETAQFHSHVNLKIAKQADKAKTNPLTLTKSGSDGDV